MSHSEFKKMLKAEIEDAEKSCDENYPDWDSDSKCCYLVGWLKSIAGMTQHEVNND